MKLCALLLISALVVIGQQIEDAASWARLKISPDIFSIVQYGNLEVKIYEELRKPNASKRETNPWYFFTPINLLLHQRSKCILNRATKRYQIDVVIQFWNEGLRKKIIHHLKHNEHIENPKVAVIPFEQVMLTIKKQYSNSYRPDTDWVPFNGKKLHNFCLIVDSEADCAVLADYMLVEPNRFDFFRLEFNVDAVSSMSRIAVIEVNSIRQGSLFSKLDQQFPQADSVLLTAKDTDRLLSESTSTIIASTFDDSEVPNPKAEEKIYSILQRLLKDSDEQITKESSLMWSSVFYEKENYRPDKLSKTINDIHHQSNEESQKMLRTLFSNSKSSTIDMALELIKHRLFTISDNDSKSASNSEQSVKSTSNSRSDSSASSNKSDFQKKDQQRNDNETSTSVKVGFKGWGAKVEGEVKANAKTSNESISERLGGNATSSENSGSSSISDDQKRAREEVHSLSRQKDRSAVSNDHLAEKLARASANSDEEKNEMQEIFKKIIEAKESVEWNGEKFQPKPMILSRINLAKVRISSTFGSHDVKVSYSKATLIAGVNFASHSSPETIFFLAEIQDALQVMERKIEALEKRRLEEMDDLKSKIEAVEHHKNQLDRGQTEQTDALQKIDHKMNVLERGLLKETERYIIHVDQRTKELAEEQLRMSVNLVEESNRLQMLNSTLGKTSGLLNDVLDIIPKLHCPQSIGMNSTCKFLKPHGCYCIVKSKAKWIQGNRHCRSQGMQLVSIESEAEHLEIGTFLREQRDPLYEIGVWTSGLYNIEKRKWEWAATRQELDLTNLKVDTPFDHLRQPFPWAMGLYKNDGSGIEIKGELNDGFLEIRAASALYYTSDAHDSFEKKQTDNGEFYMCEKTNPFFKHLLNKEIQTEPCEITDLSSKDTIDLEWNCFAEVSGCYCYPTTPEAMDWFDAFLLCKSIDMNLVSLETTTEINALAIGLPDSYETEEEDGVVFSNASAGLGFEVDVVFHKKKFWWTSGILKSKAGVNLPDPLLPKNEVYWEWATKQDYNYEDWLLETRTSDLGRALAIPFENNLGLALNALNGVRRQYPLCEK